MKAWILMHKDRKTNSPNEVCTPSPSYNFSITGSGISKPKPIVTSCEAPSEWVKVEVTFPCMHKAVCAECGVNL